MMDEGVDIYAESMLLADEVESPHLLGIYSDIYSTLYLELGRYHVFLVYG